MVMVANPMLFNNYSRIPSKLKGYTQWVVWRYEDVDGRRTKVPYCAHSGHKASTTNSAHWSTFNQAMDALEKGIYSGLGFVLSENDPFIFIDLDDPGADEQLRLMHQKIVNTFKSYAERSPSGLGTHIICEGEIADGKRSSANAAEMYSSGRYMTMTGDAVNDYEITNQQEYVEALYKQLDHARSKPKLAVDNTVGRFESLPQERSDEDVLAAAFTAQNGELFKTLYNGGWETNSRYLHSNKELNQSAADQAFFNFAGFHSKNAEQIVRLFHQSALGKRKKAFRPDYIKTMLDNSADWKSPPMDLVLPTWEALKEMAAENVSTQSAAKTTTEGKGDKPTASENDSHITALQSTPSHLLKPPPGLLGEVAAYIYAAAPRPVPAIALAGAIGLLAGICGKGFNVSNTGLNQYVLLLAETGRGKEAMKTGIKAIVNSMMMTNITADKIIGAGTINSGQALRPYLENHPTRCFLSIQSEFDNTYSQMVSANANGAMRELKKQYLDLYMASGSGASTEESIYSDKAKGTISIKSPAFSLLAECTLTHMNKILTEDQISDGLLTRFLNIVYDGPRVPRNENAGSLPPLDMINKLCAVHAAISQKMGRNEVVTIVISDEAKKIFDQLDTYCDQQMNAEGNSSFYALWNRVHLKALKLAGLLAACDYAHITWTPTITAEYAAWARDVVVHDVMNILTRFERHEVGDQSNELAQMRDLKKALLLYPNLTVAQLNTARITKEMRRDNVFTHKWISSRTAGLASFKNDNKLRASKALDAMLKMLEEHGTIYDIRKDPKCFEKYKTNARAYRFTDFAALSD